MEVRVNAKLIYMAALAVLFLAGTVLANDDSMIAGSAEEVCPIKIGMEVPELTLKTIDGAEFSLNRAFSEMPTVLIFYRGSW